MPLSSPARFAPLSVTAALLATTVRPRTARAERNRRATDKVDGAPRYPITPATLPPEQAASTLDACAGQRP